MLGYSREGLTSETRQGQPTVVRLRNEIDIAQAGALRRILDEAIDGGARVVVDLTDATFIDGCVLGVLAQANARCPEGLRVRGAGGVVARLFELTGMDHLLEP